MSHLGLHLFLGPDRARKLQRIQEIGRTLGVDLLDRHYLHPAAMSSAELIALCRQRPATSAARLIVVDEAQRLTGDCVNALLHHAQVIARNACAILLIEEDLNIRHPFAPYLSGTALASSQRGAHDSSSGGVTIERFPKRDAPNTKPFALVEALGRRDVVGALAALQDQVVGGREPLELLGLVGWQLQRWVMVRRLLDAGYTAEHVASVTGLSAWQVQRVQSEITDRSLEGLERLLTRCWQLDVDAKQGRAIPGLAVEQLVLEVCQP